MTSPALIDSNLSYKKYSHLHNKMCLQLEKLINHLNNVNNIVLDARYYIGILKHFV